MRGVSFFYYYSHRDYIASIARLGVEKYKVIENAATNFSFRTDLEIDSSYRVYKKDLIFLIIANSRDSARMGYRTYLYFYFTYAMFGIACHAIDLNINLERIACCALGHFIDSVIHDNVYFFDSCAIGSNPTVCCNSDIFYRHFSAISLFSIEIISIDPIRIILANISNKLCTSNLVIFYTRSAFRIRIRVEHNR